MCLYIIRTFPIRRPRETPHARILSCPSNRSEWEWTVEHQEDWQAFVAQLPKPEQGWKALRYKIHILNSQVPPWRALVTQTDSPGSVFNMKWWWPPGAAEEMEQLLVENKQLQLEFIPYKWYWSCLPKLILTLGQKNDRSPLPGQPNYSHGKDKWDGKEFGVNEGQLLTHTSVEYLESCSNWQKFQRADNYYDSVRSTAAVRGSFDQDATLDEEDLPPAHFSPEKAVAQP